MEEADLDSVKKLKKWFLVAQTVSGESRVYDKEQFSHRVYTLGLFRTDIIRGEFTARSAVDIHAKNQYGKWSKTTLPLAEFAKKYFKLRVLYQPVWSHAMAGLQWGAKVGIGLMVLSTLIMLWSIDPTVVIIGVALIAVCFTRIWFIAVLFLVYTEFKTGTFVNVNAFVIPVIVSAITGFALGCLPGMAIGGAIGLSRRNVLPRAPDAAPEPDDIILKAFLFPLIGGVSVWVCYLFFVYPWAESYLR